MKELSIGGLRFAVELPRMEPSGKALDRIELIETDVTYTSFLAPGTPADLSATVSLTLDAAPDVSALPVLFETGETWTAYSDGDDIVLRLRASGGPADYLWQAHLASGADDRVTVHCGPLLIERRSVPGQGEVIELTNPLHYPLDQLLMMFLLAPQQGVIIHAAGIVRAGRGVFCAGRSGAGKTTFMRQCVGHTDLEGLSDDRVIAREIDGALSLFGTPWAGEGRVAANRRVDLATITFLHQSQKNELRRIGAAAALQQLLATVSVLWFDRLRMESALRFCEQLVSNVPCYELHFRPEPAAVDLLHELI